MPTKLLVVEDDTQLRSTLARFLSQEGFEVFEAADGRSIDEVVLANVSLVLMDINLPGESGFDIAARVRRQCPSVGLIMLTARGELVDRVLGLELGADDYIQKPFELRELLARVRAVLRRSRLEPKAADEAASTPTNVIHFQGWTVYPGSRKVVAPCGREVGLTTTEFDILGLLSDHRGHTVSRQQLYEAIRGKEWSPLDRTLDTHVANLRKKLESTGGAGLIKTIHGQGYVLAVD